MNAIQAQKGEHKQRQPDAIPRLLIALHRRGHALAQQSRAVL